MVTLVKLENGNLNLVLNDKEELKEILSKNYSDERHYLADILEASGYIGNDWYNLMLIGLTEAPAIGFGAIYEGEDSEEPFDYENVWWFPYYMASDYLQELLNNGSVIFEAAN